MIFPQWITKKVVAWSLYDFADTAFSALFITFFFPILIKVHLGGTEFQIGLAMGLSVLGAALAVPLIGAISDASGKRMPILIWAALSTAMLAILAGYSGLFAALLFGFLANITHLISKDVYDAKMIDIVPRSLFGSLSGLGVGIGYFGTITSLTIGYLLFSLFGWDNITSIRAAFWEAGIFYVVFSLPLFLLVPDRALPTVITLRNSLRKGLGEIKQTLTGLNRFPVFARFLAASFFYNNGMNTAIMFLALYAREVIGLGIQQFFPIFAAMALAAALGSFVSGYFSDRFGPFSLLNYTLFVWIGIILVLIFAPSFAVFLATGVIGGASLGAIWTLNRHVVARVSPEQKIAEFFGFEGLTEKFSGLLGPVIFGFLATSYGYPPALLSMLVFFVVGLVLLLWTKKSLRSTLG